MVREIEVLEHPRSKQGEDGAAAKTGGEGELPLQGWKQVRNLLNGTVTVSTATELCDALDKLVKSPRVTVVEIKHDHQLETTTVLFDYQG